MIMLSLRTSAYTGVAIPQLQKENLWIILN